MEWLVKFEFSSELYAQASFAFLTPILDLRVYVLFDFSPKSKKPLHQISQLVNQLLSEFSISAIVSFGLQWLILLKDSTILQVCIQLYFFFNPGPISFRLLTYLVVLSLFFLMIDSQRSQAAFFGFLQISLQKFEEAPIEIMILMIFDHFWLLFSQNVLEESLDYQLFAHISYSLNLKIFSDSFIRSNTLLFCYQEFSKLIFQITHLKSNLFMEIKLTIEVYLYSQITIFSFPYDYSLNLLQFGFSSLQYPPIFAIHFYQMKLNLHENIFIPFLQFLNYQLPPSRALISTLVKELHNYVHLFRVLHFYSRIKYQNYRVYSYDLLLNWKFIKSSMLRFTQLQNHFLRFSSTRTVSNIDFLEEGPLTKVTLNRPKALNSLNLQMIQGLSANLESLAKSKVFWLQGAGGKAFCAGGDVKALFDKDSKVEDRLNFFREEFKLDYQISQLNTVQVANWDGIVMGGGFGVSAFAPFRIATENTMFAMPQAKLGFFTDVGSSYILSRLRNNIGYYLGLTGSRLKGQEVYLSGLANYYIPREFIQSAYDQIKQALSNSSNPKQTVTSVLTKFHKPSGKQEITNQNEIKQLFSIKSLHELYNKASNNSDKFHQAVIKGLNEQSPLSVGIVKKLIDSAHNKSIKQCFLQDFYLCQKAIVDNNFAEGVRTVLVERGSVPNWSHKHILDVKDSDVDAYFSFPASYELLAI